MATWSQRMFRSYVGGPDHPAKLRIVRLLWKWFVPADGVLCELDNGVQMWLHPEDEMERKLYAGEAYECLTERFLAANLHRGGVAMFVGANSGLYLISAGKMVGPSGKVIGVEPQPQCVHRALRNIRTNGLDNVILVSGGLGSTNRIIPMDEPPSNNTGWGSFVLRETGTVPFYTGVFTYAALMEQLDVDEVDLMLLDVEGYELPVLEGMQAHRPPRILLVELHPKVLELLSQSDENYYRILHSMGYSTWTLNGQPAQPGCSIPDNNLVCIHADAATPVW